MSDFKFDSLIGTVGAELTRAHRDAVLRERPTQFHPPQPIVLHPIEAHLWVGEWLANMFNPQGEAPPT